MQTHDLIQGSPEWHAHRAAHFNASDAPAMLGCSPYVTRAQLMHQLHTGITPEHDAATEQRFADGHRFEALARPIAEGIIGEELYPVTGSEGKLSASFDGLTTLDDVAFEHKSLNAELRSVMVEGCTGAALPKVYRVQMEQQCMVSGCAKVLFVASKWEGEPGAETLVEERHCWYHPDRDLRAEIAGGWEQFEQDLCAYTPPEVTLTPVAAPIEALPALMIQLEGKVVTSNLEVFEKAAAKLIAGIKTDLQTDQDFADAANMVKFCDDGEKRLALVKEQALAQTASIDALFRTVDNISAQLKVKRLELDKLVEARKVSIRTEIVQKGKDAFAEHITGLTTRIGKPYMPTIATDFPGVIKGKRTVASLREAVDVELTRAKIEASRIADAIQVNMNWLREHAKDYTALFPDTGTLVLKAHDDMVATATNRINEHKQAEQKRLDDERERIRKEEIDRIEREQQAARQAELLREQEASEALKPAPTPAPVTVNTLPHVGPPASTATLPHIGPVANVVQLGSRAAPISQPLQEAALDEWQPAEKMPLEPDQWIQVQEVVLYRWLPYKPASTEARRGIKGRWQRHNGYGFDNSEPPQGPWRIGQVESEAA